MKIPNCLRGIAFAVGAAAALCTSAMAQTFPARPVKLVVPYTPGGAADILGRVVADGLGRRLGQPVVVENKPGAGGAIAAKYVADSPPDGYTMLLGGTTPLVLYPLLYDRQVYDARKDFTGVGMLAYSPLVLVVNAQSPVRSVDEFVKASRTGSLAYGSAGNGTAMNIAGELFKARASADLMHVPYKGSPPALNALIAGDIASVFDLVASAKPFIAAGRLRPLAVLSGQRSGILPEVPTLRELGYKDFDFSVRYALIVPGATPSGVVRRLNDELNAVLREPAVSSQLGALALDVMPGPPEAVMDFARNEIERLAPVIKASGVRLD
ncbi:Tripartite tricarboxylate transporter family receptor [Pigmentiphaga humi]|uniref:Tripartite tricarboxylate transporter family receptor n=1 Tax=Pigmentiphaga humi TaxID=2478468 RepID=A0A3P4AXW3_9BURK|nr:tripartite tricarboxylate transporter substrate binding protein [Pigmentiphaga humi]VCU68206.1 Tripartite tricarboxylate transporter family receptor [Pigmentiphaga humi]